MSGCHIRISEKLAWWDSERNRIELLLFVSFKHEMGSEKLRLIEPEVIAGNTAWLGLSATWRDFLPFYCLQHVSPTQFKPVNVFVFQWANQTCRFWTRPTLQLGGEVRLGVEEKGDDLPRWDEFLCS